MTASPRRISELLWIVNLASIAACVFSYVYLSYFVYRRTGSVMASELVLIAPMVVPVLLCLLVNRLASRSPPKQLLLVANAVGVGVALLTYTLIGSELAVPAALAGALAIGFLDALQRVARTVAIKRYFSTADVQYAVPLTLTAQFIAGGVAGVGLAWFKDAVTPSLAGAIVTGAFAAAALAAGLLPRLAHVAPAPSAVVQRFGALGTLVDVLGANPLLRRGFWAFVVFVSVFQGFFNVSRVALPAHELQLPTSAVGVLQIISAMSALAGALLFVALGKRKVVLGRTAVVTLSALSLAAMVGACAAGAMLPSFVLYFVYMFVWEVLFFKYQSDLVAVTPAEHMPLVATFQYAGVYLGMIVTAALGGALSHRYGLAPTALVFAAAYAVWMPLTAWRRRVVMAPVRSA